MLLDHKTECARCYFDHNPADKQVVNISSIDVYFADTEELAESLPRLGQTIGKDEKARSDRFVYDKDRNTYISCHALLRLILGRKLGLDPLEISYRLGAYKKPMLPGNPLFFNITHTGKAFAIVVSDIFEAGIDMESVNREMNFRGIIKSFFSSRESEYILKEPEMAAECFFRLWTRKEALLKALGTGIADNLQSVEVSGQENFILRESFENLIPVSLLREHYIYSFKHLDYLLSIAVPYETEINFHQVTGSNIFSFL